MIYHRSQDTVYSNPIWFPSFKPSQATPEELEALSRTVTSPYEPTEPALSPKAWVLISHVGICMACTLISFNMVCKTEG